VSQVKGKTLEDTGEIGPGDGVRVEPRGVTVEKRRPGKAKGLKDKVHSPRYD
jgi:hypothetical protein